MKHNNNSKLKKFALLGTLLIMILALCGCRQRISNNSEVINSLYDPDGSLSYEYQYRRDELSLYEAKRPIFPNWGSSSASTEEDEYYYDDYDEVEEFEDIANQDEEQYDDEDHSTNSKTSRTGRRVSRISRRSGGTTSTKNMIKVTLDANGGKAETSEIYVTKDKTYGTLPEAEYAGYAFLGWYTEKTDGTEVTSKTKVTETKAHTLYAHWKEANTYTVTFDPNGGTLSDDNTMVISANSKYGYLPKPQYDGHVFDGWFTSADGGNLVKKGDTFKEENDITLYAHWSENLYLSWENGFNDVTKDIEELVICTVDDAEDEDVIAFISACKAENGESPEFVIKFVDKISNTNQVNKAASDAHADYPDATVLVIPEAALKGNKNEQLYYKYQVFCSLYGATFDEGTMKSDLNLKDVETIYVE